MEATNFWGERYGLINPEEKKESAILISIYNLDLDKDSLA